MDSLRVFDRHEFHRAIAMHCASSYKQAGRHWVQLNFGRRRGGEPGHASTPDADAEPEVAAAR